MAELRAIKKAARWRVEACSLAEEETRLGEAPHENHGVTSLYCPTFTLSAFTEFCSARGPEQCAARERLRAALPWEQPRFVQDENGFQTSSPYRYRFKRLTQRRKRMGASLSFGVVVFIERVVESGLRANYFSEG